jgi:RimJ/RimL family protein N-acetyltransferase
VRFFRWLSKFVDYYRQHGFRWLCRHIAMHLVHFNRLVILESEVHPNYERVEAKIPVNIRVLSSTKDDIDRLTEFWPANLYVPPFSTRQIIRDVITERLKVGEVCLVAEHNGEIVHMNWLGFHNHHVFDPYEEKRGLDPGEALSHSTYCADAYRGKHLMSAVRSRAFDYLMNNGYKTLLNYVDPDNHAAIKVTKRFGGRPVQMIYSLKIMTIGFTWFSRRKK